MTDREEDLVNAVSATTKSALGLIPGVSQAIAGYDAYQRSVHDRNVKKLLEHLDNKVSDLETFFNQKWFKTEEGELFVRKVIDAAIDVQSEEKQELFVNILINGSEINPPIEEKTKFIDMLRQLSLASIHILGEMHIMFEPQTQRAGKDKDQLTSAPQIDEVKIAKELSNKYDPYLVIAAVKELESQGLFSSIHSWHKDGEGFSPGRRFQNALAYTDFSARFAEFIAEDETKKLT